MIEVDQEKRIRYGAGWIRESADWQKRFPIGPVHWDVWGRWKEPLAGDVSVHEMQNFMVARKLLVLW